MLRAGLAFMTHNMLAPLGMAKSVTGPERNRAALSHAVSAYPALLEDMVYEGNVRFFSIF